MRKISFHLPEDPHITIEVGRSIFTGRITVLVNGGPAEKAGELSRAFLIPLSDGTVKKPEVDRGGFDYVPRVYIDGERIEIARRLKWFERMIGGLPILLLFLGGALGAICGMAGVVANYGILRSDKSTINKSLLIVGVTISSVALYFLTAIIFEFIIHR